MPAGRQHLKTHRYTGRSAYKVQPPPKEGPPFGCTPAYVMMRSTTCESVDCTDGRVEPFAASAGTHDLTHRHGQAVYDKGFPLSMQLPNQVHYVHYVLQPPISSQGVQPPTEPGDAQRFGDVARFLDN